MNKSMLFVFWLLTVLSLSAQEKEQEKEITYISLSGGYYIENGTYTGALEMGVLYKSLVGGINFSYYDKPMNKLFLGLNLETKGISFMTGGAFGLSGYKEMTEKEKLPSIIAGGWARFVVYTKSPVLPFVEYCKDYIFTSKETKSRFSFGIKILLE